MIFSFPKRELVKEILSWPNSQLLQFIFSCAAVKSLFLLCSILPKDGNNFSVSFSELACGLTLTIKIIFLNNLYKIWHIVTTWKQLKKKILQWRICVVTASCRMEYKWSMLNYLNIPNIMYNRSCTNSLWKQQFCLIIY